MKSREPDFRNGIAGIAFGVPKSDRPAAAPKPAPHTRDYITVMRKQSLPQSPSSFPPSTLSLGDLRSVEEEGYG